MNKRKRGYVEVIEPGDDFPLSPWVKRVRASDKGFGKCPCGAELSYQPRIDKMACAGKLVRVWLSEDHYKDVRGSPCGHVDENASVDMYHVRHHSRRSVSASGGSMYNPVNHWSEWLKRIEGDEQTELPENLIPKLLVEIAKRHLQTADLTIDDILDLMRYLKTYRDYDCRSFYENGYKILFKIAGKPGGALLTFDEREDVTHMFTMFCDGLSKLPPELSKGSSKPEYAYLLYMCCLLRGYLRPLRYLPLIQGDDVLADYNRRFYLVCKVNTWQPSRLSPTSVHRLGNN